MSQKQWESRKKIVKNVHNLDLMWYNKRIINIYKR